MFFSKTNARASILKIYFRLELMKNFNNLKPIKK